jgi:phosphomevalonate kinase
MLVRAPGKLVLSGAYAVLSGATAVVTAVDRYVLADATRSAERVTPEVQAAFGAEPAPWFDASELREGGEKLGLGSSAAILVACLAARLVLERGPVSDAELGAAVLAPALMAHARAQGGGSGVDVAAAALGGTLTFRRPPGVPREEPPETEPVALPPELLLETWWSGVPAVTSELVGRVAELRRVAPEQHARLVAAQAAASERAATGAPGARGGRVDRDRQSRLRGARRLGGAVRRHRVAGGSRWRRRRPLRRARAFPGGLS